jgi:hypothetical protein
MFRSLCRLAAVGAITSEQLAKQLNDLMADFAEARELIGEAKEALGTNYFSEDASDAKAATEKVLGEFKRLKQQLSEGGQTEAVTKIEREYNVKFDQLAAELADVLEHDE